MKLKTNNKFNIKKILSIIVIGLILYIASYELRGIYISNILTKKYYLTHKLLTKNSNIESENYAIKHITDYDSISKIVFDSETNNYIISLYQPNQYIILDKKGNIISKKNEELNNKDTFIELTKFPNNNYAYGYKRKKKGNEINIVKYHKKSFEWPGFCPFILIPICGDYDWKGTAFFELKHLGETLKFNLPTEKGIFLTGYNGQVFKYSLGKDNKIAFLNITYSDNTSGREEGIYVITEK